MDLPLVTAPAVKDIAKHSWSDLEDRHDFISLTSRLHGNVGNETPGENDILEGKRLLEEVQKAFPASDFLSSFDVVDEWVCVELRKEPLSEEEKLVNSQRAERHEVARQVEAIAREIDSPTDRIHLTFQSGYRAEGMPFRPAKLSLTAKFGERILYKNDRNCDFTFKTAEEAAAAVEKVLPKITGLSLGNWEALPVRPLYEKETYNFRPPNNIIERSSEVTFEARVNLPSDRKPEKQHEVPLPASTHTIPSPSNDKRDGI